MVAHRVVRRMDLFYDIGVPHGVFPDTEKCCFGLVLSEQFEHFSGVNRVRAIVKSEGNLFVGSVTAMGGLKEKVGLDIEHAPGDEC